MPLQLQPITFPEAAAFIKEHHRHHLPPQGWKWGIAVNNGQSVVGVITVGRPVARHLDDDLTLAEESGTSLKAAGWRVLYETKARPGGWDMPGRPRVNTHPLGAKTLWEAP